VRGKVRQPSGTSNQKAADSAGGVIIIIATSGVCDDEEHPKIEAKVLVAGTPLLSGAGPLFRGIDIYTAFPVSQQGVEIWKRLSNTSIPDNHHHHPTTYYY
jgi:hypothetical protein